MKTKLLLHIFLVLLLSVGLANTGFAITTLGGNPFYPATLNSADEMKSMLLEKQEDVKKGLVRAGYGDLYDPFIAQLPDAEVLTVEYQKGQTLAWMFYRKKGKGPVRIDKDVVWEGNESFTGYEFFIDHNGARHTFVVPLICGNLSLKDIKAVPPPVVVAPPVAAPAVVAVVAPPPPEPVKAARLPLLFDVGYLHQLDPAHHVLVRGGLEYAFNESFSVIGMLGAAAKYDGTEGKSAFIADVFANYNVSRFFVGAGLGAWISGGESNRSDEDNDLDLIVNFGARIFGEPDAFNTSFFVEARSAVDELDEFDLYGRIGAGLRFRF